MLLLICIQCVCARPLLSHSIGWASSAAATAAATATTSTLMLRQKHLRRRRSQASFTTKGLRPQLSSSYTISGLLQILEESMQVEICVGLVDAVQVKAARNNL
jgi:hypothetical protein